MLDIALGQKIASYRVQSFLGRGAFAQIYLALDSRNKPVAIKVGDQSGGGRYLHRFGEVTSVRSPEGVSPDETPAEALFLDPVDGSHAELLDAPEVDDLLRSEAALLRAAHGRGTPKLRRVAEHEGRPALVMEYIAGKSLRDRIRDLSGIKLRWVLQAVRQLEILIDSGAWRRHGDIKPENILVAEDEQVYLIDPSPEDLGEGRLISTPFYNPFLRDDAKADVQAFGIILYEMLTGALPFDQVPWEFAGRASLESEAEERDFSYSYYLTYPRPRELNANSPAPIERAIYRCLCDENFGLTELRGTLEDFLQRR